MHFQICTIVSLLHEVTPTCMLKWQASSCVQLTSATLYEGAAQPYYDTAETTSTSCLPLARNHSQMEDSYPLATRHAYDPGSTQMTKADLLWHSCCDQQQNNIITHGNHLPLTLQTFSYKVATVTFAVVALAVYDCNTHGVSTTLTTFI